MLALFGAPRNGIIARYIIERRRTRALAQDVLYAYIQRLNHKAVSKEYYCINSIAQQLGWKHAFTKQVIALAVHKGVVQEKNNILVLTDANQGYRHTLDEV